MPENNDRKPDQDATNRRTTFIALGVVIVLFVIGWIVTQELYSNSKTEDCVMSGRTNCVTIEAPSSY